MTDFRMPIGANTIDSNAEMYAHALVQPGVQTELRLEFESAFENAEIEHANGLTVYLTPMEAMELKTAIELFLFKVAYFGSAPDPEGPPQ